MKSIINRKAIFLLIILFFIFGLNSCSKKTDETADTNDIEEAKTEEETVSNDNFTENDEDLLTVDYKEFYEDLSPHGEWIEVTDKEIGLDLEKGTASGESEHKRMSFSDLFGVKQAYADEVNFGTFFVWKPAPGLSVTAAAGESEPAYVPYTNGQWTYTDAGWYFKAPTPYEEIVHHYGRWTYSPSMGWVWVPGRVWSPAWVDWREDDSYIAWTPVPPSVYIVDNEITPPPVYNERYVVVERKFFTAPDVYKYVYRNNKNKYTVTTWRRVGGITVVNKTVVNNGPDFSLLQKLNRDRLNMIRLMRVREANRVKYASNEFVVYTPQFRKIKTKRNISRTIVQPKHFRKYENVSSAGTPNKTESPGSKNTEAGKQNIEKNNVNKGKSLNTNKNNGNPNTVKKSNENKNRMNNKQKGVQKKKGNVNKKPGGNRKNERSHIKQKQKRK